MNKRGDMAIVVLVFLIIIVCGIALLNFNSVLVKSKGNILDYRFIDSVYGEEYALNFYLRESTEPLYLTSYLSALSSGQVILEGEELFLSLDDSKSDLVLETKLKKLFNEKLKNLDFSQKKMDSLLELKWIKYKLNKGDFSLEGDLNNLELNIPETLFQKTFEGNLEILYSPTISISYFLEEFGLVSIKNLFDYKNICLIGDVDERIDCLNENSKIFPQFDIDVFKNKDDKILVRMKSKRQFLMDNHLQNFFIRFFVI